MQLIKSWKPRTTCIFLRYIPIFSTIRSAKFSAVFDTNVWEVFCVASWVRGDFLLHIWATSPQNFCLCDAIFPSKLSQAHREGQDLVLPGPRPPAEQPFLCAITFLVGVPQMPVVGCVLLVLRTKLFSIAMLTRRCWSLPLDLLISSNCSCTRSLFVSIHFPSIWTCFSQQFDVFPTVSLSISHRWMCVIPNLIDYLALCWRNKFPFLSNSPWIMLFRLSGVEYTGRVCSGQGFIMGFVVFLKQFWTSRETQIKHFKILKWLLVENIFVFLYHLYFNGF